MVLANTVARKLNEHSALKLRVLKDNCIFLQLRLARAVNLKIIGFQKYYVFFLREE